MRGGRRFVGRLEQVRTMLCRIRIIQYYDISSNCLGNGRDFPGEISRRSEIRIVDVENVRVELEKLSQKDLMANHWASLHVRVYAFLKGDEVNVGSCVSFFYLCRKPLNEVARKCGNI